MDGTTPREQPPEAVGSDRYWLIIAVAFAVLALSGSARAALGLAMSHMESDPGWSRSFVSATGASALLVMAAMAPLAGHLSDRFGARPVLCTGLLTLALGCAICATTSNRFVFLVAFGGIAGAGFGIVSWNVVSVMVVRIATRRPGTATGVANTGSSAGQFVIVPALGMILAAASWRWSFAGLALASLVLAPVVWRLLAEDRVSRSAVGLPSGESRDGLTHLIRRPVFHMLFWSFLLCGYTTTGVVETHFLPYSSFCGFGPVPGATAYGLLSVVNTAGMIGAGFLADRMNRPLLLAAIYLIRGATFVILMNVGASYETLLVFALLYGVVDYSTVPVTVSLAASHLGTRSLGLAIGLIAAGHNVGAALGAFAGGYLFDLTSSYEDVWWSSVAMATVAGAIVLFISKDSGDAASPPPDGNHATPN